VNGPPQEPPGEDPRGVAPPAHLQSRTVPWRNALTWYEDAMRLVKRAPATWGALAFLTLACEIGLEAVPDFGPMLSKIVVPLVACGMLYAAAATDRGGTPSLRHALAAFRAPAPAIAAVIAAGLLTFAAEALAAWWIAGADLLAPGSASSVLTAPQVGGIYAIGILASLPLTFVPFHVLFEQVAVSAAFAASWNAFVRNTVPLLVYAAASLVLLGFGLATMGVGLVIVLPLWAASSYAAWKDVFGVRDAPAAG
jgi:uncharacterized membrane protein